VVSEAVLACSWDDLVSRKQEAVVAGVPQLEAVDVGDLGLGIGPVQTIAYDNICTVGIKLSTQATAHSAD
jgi:hypothetical protein